MKEPINSWEISFVILHERPNSNIGISYQKCFSKIGKERAIELKSWIPDNFNGKWVKDHI